MTIWNQRSGFRALLAVIALTTSLACRENGGSLQLLLSSGAKIGLYQPKHPTAVELL
jgi:hypothetical protein